MTTKMEKSAMSERVIVLDEPTLQFGGGQDTIDPHDGLALFGPFSLQTSSHPRSPAYVVLSTKEGLDIFKRLYQDLECILPHDHSLREGGADAKLRGGHHTCREFTGNDRMNRTRIPGAAAAC